MLKRGFFSAGAFQVRLSYGQGYERWPQKVRGLREGELCVILRSCVPACALVQLTVTDGHNII